MNASRPEAAVSRVNHTRPSPRCRHQNKVSSRLTTVVKMLGYSYKLSSPVPEDAVSAAPQPQLFKAAPLGNLTQEHRSDPHSSRPTSLCPHGSLNRIGSASPPPQPMLRCKRRSQLTRHRAPVRPHVLHSLKVSRSFQWIGDKTAYPSRGSIC